MFGKEQINRYMKKQIVITCMALTMAGMIVGCGQREDTADTQAEETQTEETQTEEAANEQEETESGIVSIPIDEDNSTVQVFNPPATDENSDMTLNEKAQAEGLPQYKSAVSGSIEEAITLYLWKEFGFEEANEPGAVNIPAYVIIRQTEADDITRVYGDFWVYGYKLEGKNLSCISGGSYAGVFYLRQNENGYEAQSFEMVADGSGYEESLDKICEGDEELKQKFLDVSDASNDECKAARRNFINLYAVANNLEIESYQDYGWDPVMLNE